MASPGSNMEELGGQLSMNDRVALMAGLVDGLHKLRQTAYDSVAPNCTSMSTTTVMVGNIPADQYRPLPNSKLMSAMVGSGVGSQAWSLTMVFFPALAQFPSIMTFNRDDSARSIRCYCTDTIPKRRLQRLEARLSVTFFDSPDDVIEAISLQVQNTTGA
jgi:hypothetical protein